MSISSERTGIMVVRIWTEGSEEHIHARLTGRLDLNASEELVSTAGTVDQIVAIVRRWGDAFVAQDPGPDASFRL
jgi:hypothetical protein